MMFTKCTATKSVNIQLTPTLGLKGVVGFNFHQYIFHLETLTFGTYSVFIYQAQK